MEFSFWDWVITLIALLQLGMFAWLGYALYKMRKGPVNAFITRGSRLALRVNLLAKRGMQIFAGNFARGEELATHVKGIGEGVRYGTRTDFGDRITYRSLLASWASLQTGLGTVSAALGFLRGMGTRINPPKVALAGGSRQRTAPPPGPVRRSLLDRMGLVPPIAKPLGKVWQYMPLALDFYREFRRRMR